MKPRKLHNIGILAKRDSVYGSLTWEEFSNTEDFKNALERHSIRQDQIKFIKQGFKGEKLNSGECSYGTFPFGIHKGKEYHEVPEKYIVWCSKQDWLDKWPMLKNYVTNFLDGRKQDAATQDDIKSILQKIK